eukprot:TRINITY_DN22801_c0_g1_i1.p1 TRINITY_DN22801_c0_g1~~TRINITY_DN22801_c0_g1_i1.p1  ORF type:complete len:230 (+),score=22.79 TRINITY_DN22801_c0_g1_i1:166-855(+)
MELTGYSLGLVEASWMTVQLAFVSLLVGLVLAVLFASGEMSRRIAIKWPTTAFVTIVRGFTRNSGRAVYLLWFDTSSVHDHWRLHRSEPVLIWCCCTVHLFLSSYASQTLRGALKAVSKGQREAASALGISQSRAFFRIVLPQAVRHALPGLTNQWLVLLKDTALVSLIGVTDLLKQAQLTSAATHEAFTWYATAAAIYLVITLITQRLVKVIDGKFSIQGLGNKGAMA